MLGAIAGDIIGSVYEGANIKTPHFEPLFHPRSHPTDDTMLTLAVAEWILAGAGDDLPNYLRKWFAAFPMAGYGGTFIRWAGGKLGNGPYGSWGNGSAMRASPIGFAFETLDDVLLHAKRSAEVTHDHPEGIKGAQAVAAAVFLARSQHTRSEIRNYIEATFQYDLTPTIDEIRPGYQFDVSCQGSVPQSITAFLEAEDYEAAVRKAISIGGDSDTIASIAGGIAHACFGPLPKSIEAELFSRINDQMEEVIDKFVSRYPAAA
jgi:ADP-ribosylglycohydrolase